jgi:amidase
MNYTDFDGLGLAGLVRQGQVSPDELLREAIRRLEAVNPALNAVITPMYDSARARCELPPGDGPFAGVPFLVKDLMLFLAGERLSNGSRALLNFRPDRDCSQAKRIREAGFVVFGKTNCSELGAQPLTNPVAFGPTANPWNTSLNAGGSSGGSTAAVAARVVPMAASSDGGGSIRLPASYCGVFGFKPSRGLNPHESVEAWGGAVVTQATTLTVRDSAAYLDWTSRKVRPNGDRPEPESLLASTEEATPRLRIGFTCESPVGGAVHPECVRAVEHTAHLLESLGHAVEPCPTPYNGREVMRALLTIVAAYTYRDLKRMGEWVSRPWRKLEVEPATRFLGETGSGISDHQLADARACWEAAAARMEDFHETYPVLLTPVVATLPLEHSALSASATENALMRLLSALHLGSRLHGPGLLDQAIDKGIAPLPFMQIANITGQPAMSVPLYWTQTGLPVGSHFLAARGQDGLLFNLAAQLERAEPWFQRRPPVGLP